MKLRPRTKGSSLALPFLLWGPRMASFLFVILALSLFLFSMARPAHFSSVRMGTTDVFSPLLTVINAPIYKAASYVQAVTGLAALQAENARLYQENSRLREWYQTALFLKSENESLQGLLNIHLEPQHSYITARVISDSGNAYVKSLLVMAGQDQGVQAGQAVLGADGLIGRVVEAGSKSARVLLLTDINSRIPVMLGESFDRAILAGSNSDLPSLIHLLPDSQIQDGARVLTSGHGGLFPVGLPIGEFIRDDNGQPAVRLFADLNRVAFVRIVDKAEDPRLRQGGQGGQGGL